MIRSLFTVGSLTLVSRILGFVREGFILHYLGAGPAAEAWVAAFRFPNLFRRVFGEGAFNAAFVPVYSRKIEEDGDASADNFGSRTISMMFFILSVLCLLSFIFMRPITRVVALGYEGETFEMAVSLSRITAVYMIFVCLMAAFAGILNSRKVFGAPAFAYVLLNIVFLVGLIFVVPKTGHAEFVLAWCVVIAGVLQLGVVAVAARRRGVRIRLHRPRMDADLKHLALLMAPGLVSAGVQQLNLVVGQTVASFQDGGTVFIFTSDRINQLPLGIIGMSFLVVLLPEITRHLRAGREKEARESLARGVDLSLLLTLPAMFAMLVIPGELVFALFKSGQFTLEDSRQTGMALAAFALGTPAYILLRVLQPGYFARENTRTPMNFTIVSAVTNMVLCVPLFFLLKHVGCALATSIAGWVNVILLAAGLHRLGFLKMPEGFGSRLLRMIIAAGVMAVAVWWGAQLTERWLFVDSRVLRLSVLGGIVAGGAAIYFLLIFALRVWTISELKQQFRRRRPAK